MPEKLWVGGWHRRLLGVAQSVIRWVVLMILVSSPVQSSEIWSSTGLSLDNIQTVSCFSVSE